MDFEGLGADFEVECLEDALRKNTRRGRYGVPFLGVQVPQYGLSHGRE